MKKIKKYRNPIEYVYILRNPKSGEYTAVQLDIDVRSSKPVNVKRDVEEAAALIIGHPDYMNYEVINFFPLDEMGYFRVKTKMVLY